MTTPAQDAPLVFPSVAFRPVRLLVVCVALTGLALAASGFMDHVFFGVFFGIGLGLGLLNALMVRRAVESITAEEHPLKKKMAVNSMTRLLVITAVGLTIAIVFKKHDGLAVLFGLAIFQAVLVMSTSIPVMKKIRANGLDVAEVSATESKDRADG
ncbi:ATP synthase subunit I [Mycolicibacterium sp. 050158]|jgi:ATP synthase I chain|uniref:ATP synthase subunit I n=1 Tax=Mycolicibacterium sp. 050158 TaxID=3090602 RepID=UPI00299D415E|nr:ATP synthase subunit I [Mycolicibacterium sp. 050158]MDX1892968.1 ATP synthase subunit I [Mycolicibacterium sp. 050158]